MMKHIAILAALSLTSLALTSPASAQVNTSGYYMPVKLALQAAQVGFPILTDRAGDVAAVFGIRWLVPDELRVVHRHLGADLSIFNGEASWTLPMPARYVIGPDSVIAYSEINPNSSRRPEPHDLFATLERLQSGARA